MRENSDVELLAAARDGNKDAFGYLVERYQHMTKTGFSPPQATPF